MQPEAPADGRAPSGQAAPPLPAMVRSACPKHCTGRPPYSPPHASVLTQAPYNGHTRCRAWCARPDTDPHARTQPPELLDTACCRKSPGWALREPQPRTQRPTLPLVAAARPQPPKLPAQHGLQSQSGLEGPSLAPHTQRLDPQPPSALAANGRPDLRHVAVCLPACLLPCARQRRCASVALCLLTAHPTCQVDPVVARCSAPDQASSAAAQAEQDAARAKAAKMARMADVIQPAGKRVPMAPSGRGATSAAGLPQSTSAAPGEQTRSCQSLRMPHHDPLKNTVEFICIRQQVQCNAGQDWTVSSTASLHSSILAGRHWSWICEVASLRGPTHYVFPKPKSWYLLSGTGTDGKLPGSACPVWSVKVVQCQPTVLLLSQESSTAQRCMLCRRIRSFSR